MSKTFLAYLLAFTAGILTFVPWLLIVISNYSQFQSASSWSTTDTSLSSLITNWIYNLSYVFIDFWYIFTYFPDSPFNLRFGKYLIPLVLILVGYSLYILFRQTPKRTWLFLLTLIGSTALAIILPDLILGGYRSIMARYFIPCYIGIQIAVAYLLATRIQSISAPRWQQKLWRLILILLVSGGILSCAVSSQAETWWNKRTTSDDNLHAIRIINQAKQPLLIVEDVPLSISHKLNPRVRLMVVNPSTAPKIPDSFSDVFFLEPSKRLKSKIEKELNSPIKIVYKGRKQSLWQLERKYSDSRSLLTPDCYEHGLPPLLSLDKSVYLEIRDTCASTVLLINRSKTTALPSTARLLPKSARGDRQ